MKSFLKNVYFAFCFIGILSCKHTSAYLNSTADLKNLTLVGYQGWFGTPHDKVHNTWQHWSKDPNRAAGESITFDLYPDTSDYPEATLWETELGALGNGKPSKLFSSVFPAVVQKHFEWIRDYKLDGVVLQRFIPGLGTPSMLQARNQVADLVRTHSENYEKHFYLMYDISGGGEDFSKVLKKDLEQQLEEKLELFQSSAYVKINKKPVIGLWGVGFRGRPGTQEELLELVDWLHAKGFYVAGGVSYFWRDNGPATKGDYHQVYQKLDMIIPWSVSAVRSIKQVRDKHYQRIQADMTYCRQHGIDYQVVIYPGFSWSNLKKATPNAVPRLGGSFMWEQAKVVKELKAGAFVAMFDEYDESTAIAKAAATKADVPKDTYFLTLDADGLALPSDHYLKLTGRITQFLRSP